MSIRSKTIEVAIAKNDWRRVVVATLDDGDWRAVVACAVSYAGGLLDYALRDHALLDDSHLVADVIELVCIAMLVTMGRIEMAVVVGGSGVG